MLSNGLDFEPIGDSSKAPSTVIAIPTCKHTDFRAAYSLYLGLSQAPLAMRIFYYRRGITHGGSSVIEDSEEVPRRLHQTSQPR